MLNISIYSADKQTRACSEICILTITSHREFKIWRIIYLLTKVIFSTNFIVSVKKSHIRLAKKTSRLRKNVELIVNYVFFSKNVNAFVICFCYVKPKCDLEIMNNMV